MDWSRLFPKIEKDYSGSKFAFYFLILIAVVSTIRSFIHVFAPDGGAKSIAGIDIAVQGGGNIVAIFAQWGVLQLLLALFYWIVIFRYRFFVPAMLAVVVVEQLFRLGAGLIKPLDIISPPPGSIGSIIFLPLSIIALLCSLTRDTKK